MYTEQGKKLSIIYILKILMEETDADHTLSSAEIVDLLERDYSMKIDRKAVKKNIMSLIDAGYEIGYKEVERKGKNGEEETIYTDWYFIHDFAGAELRLLIDSLLFSKHIPRSQCKSLIEKLKKLASKHFSTHVKHISNLPGNNPVNPQIFLNIDMLDEAIDKKRKVEFSFGNYSYKKKLVLNKDDKGKEIRYLFNPYQMVATNGKYYIIGNYDRYDNVAYVRVDHLSDVEILDEKRKPKRAVKGLENGLDLPKTMAEHIYMMHGETVNVKFRAPKSMSDQIVDWFGYDFTVLEENEDEIIVSVKANRRAMRFWGLQYGNFVEIMEPPELREDIKKSIDVMVENYK